MDTGIRYEQVGREQFKELLELKMRPDDVVLVMDAYNDSKFAHDHKQQRRKGGERYFEHPKRVTLILMQEFAIYDPDMLIAALLHDSVEDTYMFGGMTEAPDRLQRRYGKRVARFVTSLSKEPCDDQARKVERDHHYFASILIEGTKTIAIKVADRLDNLRDMRNCDNNHKRHYIDETRDHILPMIMSVAGDLPKEIYFAVMHAYNEMVVICSQLEGELAMT